MRHCHAAAFGIAAALSPGWTAPAAAQLRVSSPAMLADEPVASRPGDVWTAGGLLFAPRYLDNPGDVEFGIGPTYLVGARGGEPASRFGAIAGFQWKFLDSVEAAAVLGPLTLAGIRGPLHEDEFGAYGWALLYRADFYPVGTYQGPDKPVDLGNYIFGQGKALADGLFEAPFLGGVALSQGGELRVEAMEDLGPIKFFVTPAVGVMTDGTRLGLGLGLDLDFDRLVIGGNWTPRYNLTPTRYIVDPARGWNRSFENYYSAGGRVVLTDSLYLLANYVYVPADPYGNNLASALAGIGYRFAAGEGGKK